MPWRIDRGQFLAFWPKWNDLSSASQSERERRKRYRPNWIRRGFINFHNQSGRHRGGRRRKTSWASLHLNSTCDGCASWDRLGDFMRSRLVESLWNTGSFFLRNMEWCPRMKPKTEILIAVLFEDFWLKLIYTYGSHNLDRLMSKTFWINHLFSLPLSARPIACRQQSTNSKRWRGNKETGLWMRVNPGESVGHWAPIWRRSLLRPFFWPFPS